MRCIGTLEFVNDFHNKCHQTQRQLLLDKERLRELTKDKMKIALDSDKENTAPRSNIEIKENINGVPGRSKRNSYHVDMRPGSKRIINHKNGDFKDNTSPVFGNVGNLKRDCVRVFSKALSSNEMKPSMIELKGKIIRNGETLSPRRQYSDASETREGSDNLNGQDQVSLTCFRSRKSGRKCVKKNCKSVTTNGQSRKTEKRVYPSNSDKISPIVDNVTGAVLIERLEDSTDLSKEDKYKGVIILPVPDKKIEMLHADNTTMNINDLPRVLNEIVISTTDEPSRITRFESTAKSPRPGDEAEGGQDKECDAMGGQVVKDAGKILCTKNDGIGTKCMPKATIVRKSVIESVNNGKTFGENTKFDLVNEIQTDKKFALSNEKGLLQRRKSMLSVVSENFGRSTSPPRESLSILPNKVNENGSSSVGNFQDRRNKSEGQFGKLSELITSEQKELIETLYTVNMGVIDEEEVYRNIKMLDKVKVKCEICGKSYSRMDKCQVHVWSHLGMKPYCCKSCDFATLTVSNIRCHIRKRHLKIKPFQCNLCEKTYGTAVLLEEHINSHTGAKPYKCKLCDYATSNRQVLSYHRTTHKPVKDILCGVCGKKFFSNCRMRAHMIVHNKDKNLMCKFCSTYLCNAEALEKHYQKVHSRDYICDICGVRTRSRKALTNHENVHLEAKHRCLICSNAYKSKHMLKEHLLKHQGIRKYKCDLCQKSFAQQSHIAAHMSVHMGKRYPCPGCNKLFNRRDNMRIHTRRCKIVKSNPDIKKLWVSQTSTQLPQTDDQQTMVLESRATLEVAADTESSGTDLGLLTSDLLTGETDYSNSQNINTTAVRNSQDYIRDKLCDKLKSEDGEIPRIGVTDVKIFPISESNVVTLPSEGSMLITKTVLEPECF